MVVVRIIMNFSDIIDDEFIWTQEKDAMKKKEAEEKQKKSITAIQASIHEKTAIKPATLYNVSHTEERLIE